MKTVVFVDELLLVNFAAAAALLLGAGLLCGRSCTGLRLCAGSAAAAVSTLVLLAPPWPAPLAVLYKIVSCCGVVAVCYGVAGVRSFARLCGWYAALNGLLCGAVVLPGVQANNLSVLLPVRPGQLLLCCAGVYGLLRGLLAVFGRPQRGCFAAVLQIAGATVPVQAYHDTGFTLQDPLAGRRVVLVQYPPVRSRLPAPLRAYLDSWFAAGAAPPPGLRVQFVPPAPPLPAIACCPPCPPCCAVGSAACPACWRPFAPRTTPPAHGRCCWGTTWRRRWGCRSFPPSQALPRQLSRRESL